MLSEEGKKRAKWILKRANMIDEDGIEPEYLVDYEMGYGVAIKAIKSLIKLKRYRSALYVCDMINDEMMRRSILKDGMVYYESIGDFRLAYEFAEMLGDERKYVYKKLYELYLKVC